MGERRFEWIIQETFQQKIRSVENDARSFKQFASALKTMLSLVSMKTY